MPFDLAALRDAVHDAGLDGWLFYDFRRSNPIAHRILGLAPDAMFTRRWFYYVPARGTPVALVSAVEPHVLRALPGEQRVYQTWGDLAAHLRALAPVGSRVAMEYSPDNAIPVCSRVDAGTVELVRRAGLAVVSSANLAQRFEAVLTPERLASHRSAGARLVSARDELIAWLRERLLAGDELREYTVQRHFAGLIAARGLTMPDPPLVAVGARAGNPHYAPTATDDAPLRRGDVLLLDYFGQDPAPGSVIADYTWMVALDDHAPAEAAARFAVIARARDAGIAFLRARVTAGQPVLGCEVDDVVRAVVRDAGFGDHFVHRTGHSITSDEHGNGANLDNLETHDDRPLLPNTCCSIEPGIYEPHLGVRTEVDVLILPGAIEVTGGEQDVIQPILA